MWQFFSLPATLLPLLWQVTTAATPGGACNNSPDLCSKTYDNVTHLGAHDSPFLRDSSTDFSTAGNQFYNSTVQLDSGVRLLTAQVHAFNTSSGQDEWHLCHTDCLLLDAGKLSDWLSEIKTWMDVNPNDVVTVLLVNSDNGTPQDLDEQFSASGIKSYAYIPPSTTAPPTSGSWPTLGSLISSNTRLMTFIASLDPSSNTVAPYLMDEFTFVFENPFEVTDATNFTCNPDRPSSVQNSPQSAVQSDRMFLMNHFLDQSEAFGIDTPNVDAIADTNSPTLGTSGGLAQHMSDCAAVYGRSPNFALVDFSNVGPAMQSVDMVNGVQQAVGRTILTTAVLQEAAVENGAARANGRTGAEKRSQFAFIVGFIVAIGLAS
ncbi:hypothetical protein NA57DRAFT_62829 [Rhizodiscina lignyota]|uniref:PLC-like phosphodiesterase n=1 Tax=Rhizodiscina lignyota TaxID=1504668 RepID=A0A9P4IQB3_9PEZI|nr:hypothetical protein NA57DRAFT_62829 [Rhizodiscina lignyota]